MVDEGGCGAQHETSGVRFGEANGRKEMRLALWSTTTPRQNSTDQELFRRQLDEAELAERIGIDQMWFLEHHLPPSATPSPNLMIAAASQRTRRIRFGAEVLPRIAAVLDRDGAAMRAAAE